MNLYSRIRDSLREHSRKVLLQTADREVTGNALANEVGRVAAVLLALGVEPGDRVAAQIDKSYENILLYLATLQVGAVYLPLNTAYQAPEVRYFLGDASPRVFVCTPQRHDELQAVAGECGVRHVVTLDATGEGTLPERAKKST